MFSNPRKRGGEWGVGGGIFIWNSNGFHEFFPRLSQPFNPMNHATSIKTNFTEIYDLAWCGQPCAVWHIYFGVNFVSLTENTLKVRRKFNSLNFCQIREDKSFSFNFYCESKANICHALSFATWRVSLGPVHHQDPCCFSQHRPKPTAMSDEFRTSIHTHTPSTSEPITLKETPVIQLSRIFSAFVCFDLQCILLCFYLNIGRILDIFSLKSSYKKTFFRQTHANVCFWCFFSS